MIKIIKRIAILIVALTIGDKVCNIVNDLLNDLLIGKEVEEKEG